jgi:predicted P-loop ATPase
MMRDALVELEGYRRIDSGKAWLESLVWDGVPRIEKFFPTYAATDDTAYTRAVGLYAWTAHAGRVMDPGCQADMAIVLVGDQGRGKTSLMKALVPLVDQYVELGLDVHNNDLARLMRGKLIGELAELKGIAGREMEAVKAWITRRVEEWTPKYRERTQSMPRRLVLWGSTNIERFLDDATGERRWLPATVGAIDVVAAKADRDQLWAEGLAMWKRHGVMWQDAERLATAVHEDHKMIDPWEEQIETFAQTCGLEGQKRGDQGFTMTELLTEGLGLKAAQITKAVEMRAAKALKRHGFDRRMLRVEGQRAWRWYAQDFADIC